MNILDDLQFRGLIYQSTDKEKLQKRLDSGPITLYCGFDPTADSLQVGNLVVILILKRFQLAGHKPIAIVGGGTGLIGDPSEKKKERKLNPEDVVVNWGTKVRKQLERFLDFESKNKAQVVNNYDWLSQIKIVEYLRDYGKNFSINEMLAKESVKARLETGISFTEFNYMILQSIDFLELYQKYNCELQIGGSDQWGNIISGVELIRKKINQEAFALTAPLITKSDGTKFGKTESGTIWLDVKKTSPYQFYQFWINTADQDVVNYIKVFTFLSPEEIKKIEQTTKDKPEERQAQKILAKEVTELVHGEEAQERAEKISKKLFSGDLRKLSTDEIKDGFGDVPSFENQGKERKIIDLLIDAGIVNSKRQALEDINCAAIYLNGECFVNSEKLINKSYFLFGKYLVIRRGKKNYYLINW